MQISLDEIRSAEGSGTNCLIQVHRLFMWSRALPRSSVLRCSCGAERCRQQGGMAWPEAGELRWGSTASSMAPATAQLLPPGQTWGWQELAEAPRPKAKSFAPTASHGGSGASWSPSAWGWVVLCTSTSPGGRKVGWDPKVLGRVQVTCSGTPLALPGFSGVRRAALRCVQDNMTFWYGQILAFYILRLQRQNRIELNDSLLPLQHQTTFCTLWQKGGLLKAQKSRADFLSVSERRLFC